jgi:integrase
MARVEDRWTRKDKTRTPEYGKGMRWRVVWTEADGTVKRKSFPSKDAAQAHSTWVDHNQRSGTYIQAARGDVTVAELMPVWFATQVHVKPSTRAAIESDMNATIIPYWGLRKVGAIERADVQEWVAAMVLDGKAPRTVGTIFGRFTTFMAWCVEEKRVSANPAAGVNLPRGNKREHKFLTVTQVAALAAAIEGEYRGLVWLLATTGLRISEAAELRVKDVDLRRRRLSITRSVVYVKGTAEIGPPKNGKSRTVPLTATAMDIVKAAMKDTAGHRHAPDALLFPTTRGMQIRANNFKRRNFDDAVQAVNKAAAAGKHRVRIPEGLWVHDLRHTAASWAVQSGASVKSVQRMLGHATAAMTLDVYAGLFDQDLDDVAAKMESLITEGGGHETP